MGLIGGTPATGSLNTLSIGSGTAYKITGLSGWHDETQQVLGGTTTLSSKQTLNGSWPTVYSMPVRTVVLQLTIEGVVSTGEFEAAVQALKAATVPNKGPVSLTLAPGGAQPLTATGVPISRIIPTTLDYLAGFSLAQITLECADPRLYSSASLTGSTGLPSSTGAFVFPHTFPMAWASTITSGDVVFTSTGDATGPVKVTFYGGTSGVSGPSVGQVETGLSIAFSPSLTINPGDFLTVDMENRTVLYNGQSSRANYLISRGWMGLQPGSNTFVFGSTSAYSPAPSMTVTASPAYL